MHITITSCFRGIFSGVEMENKMKEDLKANIGDYLPLRDVVFHTLRQAILKGELEPGERLMEIQLAQNLGVSRTPVREAIRKLELEGLVIMIPRKGAEVASITEKSLRDVLEVRKVLEELAAELACKRMTEDGFLELEEQLSAFEEEVKGDDLTKIAEMDVAFHDIIYKYTCNDKLVQMLNNLREQMYRYRVEYIKEKGKRSILVAEHIEIVNCIKRRDVEAAKLAVHRHIEYQESTISQKIKGE